MNDRSREIWFWQRIVSPHIAGLAVALAREGNNVVYVAEREMSDERALQGWVRPSLPGVRLELAASKAEIGRLIDRSESDSIHICQGVRGNGLVGHAQMTLAERNLRQWVVMETVDDTGCLGFLKRLEYRRQFSRWHGRLEGVLAIGDRTPEWVVARGMPAERIFPFAYFLPKLNSDLASRSPKNPNFRVIFVGNFIHLKRLGLLVKALAQLKGKNVELVVVGSGPLENQLRSYAEAVLPGRVTWIGRLPIERVPDEMAKADCLVLPSRHDGWGAVVSEALIEGTPAICSDRCGSAGVVRASGYGGVFRSGNVVSLVSELERVLTKGALSKQQRAALASWSRCLEAEAGAKYLLQVLDYSAGKPGRPEPPWK